MLATPIGNLADISLRALYVLQMVDAIACEDTRHTQNLLRSYGIEKPLIALHQHNENEAAQSVLRDLQSGKRIAYVSDAGTPAISDPGAKLAAVVIAAGLRVLPLPGASSVTTLLSACGLDANEGRFTFAGFLPSKAAARAQAVTELGLKLEAQVLLESPHRIAALAKDLATLGVRGLSVGRELTKQFEEIAHMPCSDFPAWLDASPQRGKGEFALVLHPDLTAAASMDAQTRGERYLRDMLAENMPVKSAAKLAASWTGAGRNALYELALQIKNASEAS